MVEQGDFVKVTGKKDTEISGVLVKMTSDSYVIKLESGYNIGILRANVKKIKRLDSGVLKKEVKIVEHKHDSTKKTITILHTGGTIASKVDYATGAVGSTFKPEELISLFPELKSFANIKSRLVKNMWSQDMRFVHYNILAKEIKKEVDSGVDGIVISQGTDTLHYTSCALAFILEDINIPVMIVGAQRSSDRPSTDARDNLVNAVYFMANSNFAEVAVCMHNTTDDVDCAISSPTKVRKSHTSRRDAFRSINCEPYALVNYRKNEINYLSNNFNKNRDRKLKLKLFKEDIRVGLLKQHTNMFADQFLFYKRYDGLVIESTGLGCLPISENDKETRESGKIYTALKTMIRRGLVVVEAPETINGRIVLNVYEDQREAQEIGVLGSFSDMTPETTFIKLAWLLSNYTKEETKKLLLKNLRGELNNRLGYYN
ncbi:Glu-tRNA(Gln) amidotransferase subunit GatD [Candidatus Woesearchaeota archaeon]|nr:Glu-tRNA(Gln) amidotransferase subunit GatD [Candidatus Woesearchaeota archaeon]